MSLLEAMSAGVPVIITQSANRAGLIRSGINGLVVESTTEAIAAGMLKMIGSNSDALVMAQEAMKLVQENYSLDSMMSEYEKLYQNLLHQINTTPFPSQQAKPLRSVSRKAGS